MTEKLLKSIHIFFTVALVFVVLYYYSRGPVKEILIEREVETIIDTVTITEIEERWQEIVTMVHDTVITTQPDTILVTQEVPLWSIKQLIYRLYYSPPKLEYSIIQRYDSTQQLIHYQYSDVPWGFALSPQETGPPQLTSFNLPEPPALAYGPRWGLGISLTQEGISPAGFAEYYLRWKRWTLTGRSNITLQGVTADIYLSW